MAKAENTDVKYNSKNRALDKTTQTPFQKKEFNNLFFNSLFNNIARRIRIKSNDIYTNYIEEKKQILIEDIITCFETDYMNYLHWLTKENAKATSADQVIKNMCPDPKEIFEKLDFYSIALAHRKQHTNETIHKKFSKLFYQDSIDLIKSSLDILIRREIIPPSDSKTIAIFFVQNILISSEIHIYKVKGQNIPEDLSKMYTDYKLFIISLLKN